MIKNVAKIISLILSLVLCKPSYSCGNYKTVAKVIMREGSPSLIIYPESQSEIFLKVELLESAKLAPYLNRYIMADLLILKKNDNTRYNVEKINNIKITIPKLLSSKKGTGLSLIKPSVCK